MAGLITLDIAEFREWFPAYADSSAFPDGLVHRHLDAACDHVSPRDAGPLKGDGRRRALYLMAAHLMYLEQLLLSGNAGGVVSGASIDKVSVTLTPPPIKKQLDWWLNISPYGQQLLVLLKKKGAGGLYIGGNPEREAFRKAGGGFRG